MPGDVLLEFLQDGCATDKFIRLRDTKLVIKGMGFIGVIDDHIVKNNPENLINQQDNIYGGEYLASRVKLVALLEIMQKCHITPYILFPGIYTKCDSSTYFFMLKFQKAYEDQNKRAITYPVRSKSVIIDTLRESGAKFMVVSHLLPKHLAALADFYKCPILGTSRELYLLTSSKHLKNEAADCFSRPVIPLKIEYSNMFSTLVEATPSKMYLKCHAFYTEQSKLKQLQPMHRVLAALYIGSKLRSKLKLPEEIQSKLSENASEFLIKNKWEAVIQWLSKYQTDATRPIEEFITVNNLVNKDGAIKNILESINYYVYHPDEDGAKIAEFFEQHKNPNQYVQTISNVSTENFTVKDIWSLLSGQRNPRLEPTECTRGWPPRLVYAYRTNKFDSAFVSAMYSGGSTQLAMGEDLSTEFSVYECSLPVRIMHYRIIFQLERQLGKRLRPQATEFLRRGKNVVKYKIPVEPLPIDFGQEHVDSVLSSFLGISLPSQSTEPEWIFSVATTIAFWHRNLPRSSRFAKLECCCVSMAVLACVCAAMNEAHLDETLLGHYESFCNMLEDEASGHESVALTAQVQPDLVHRFVSIQLVYSSLQSLVGLLESLLPLTHASQVFHFPPIWIMFPSGRLVHAIAHRLDLKPVDLRCQFITKSLLPRLISHRSFTESSRALSTAVRDFNHLIKLIPTLRLYSHNVTYQMENIKFHK